MAMTTPTWRLLGGTFIASLVAMAPISGQPVNQLPAPSKPITFGDGVRAHDRLSPTPTRIKSPELSDP